MLIGVRDSLFLTDPRGLVVRKIEKICTGTIECFIGLLGYDFSISDDGKAFVMDDQVVATIHSIDAFISFFEREINN